jgi:hypothetical protein
LEKESGLTNLKEIRQGSGSGINKVLEQGARKISRMQQYLSDDGLIRSNLIVEATVIKEWQRT